MAQVRRVLLNLHLWTAMIAGAVLVMLGATGALLIFEEPIDHALNPTLFRVEPRAERVSVASVLASLHKTFPGQRVGMLLLSKAPDAAVAAMMKGFTAYVDPYTGRVLGTRRGRSFTQTVHQLHMRLLIGKTGDTIVSVAALLLVFLTITGIYLWWPLKRVTVATGKSWRRFNFDLHQAVGFYSSVFLLVLAVTGVTIGFEEYTVPAMYRVTQSEPMPSSVPSAPAKGASPISPDQAEAVAEAALPGARLVSIIFPGGPKASYRVSLRYPEDLTPGGRSRVLVDQFSGRVLLVENSRTAPAGTRLVNLNRALHTGDIGGWPTKILACLISLAVVAQAFSGAVMWWKRRPATNRPAPAEEVVC